MRKKDGAFPMMSSASSEHSSFARYHDVDDDFDLPRPMCGQKALNKLLPGLNTASSPKRGGIRRSLLASSEEYDIEQQTYEQMPIDQTPMDNIYSAELSKFANNSDDDNDAVSSLNRDTEPTIYIPQFNVQKAKEHKARTQQKSLSYLPSVTEGSNEDIDRDHTSAASSLSSGSHFTDKNKTSRSAKTTPSAKEKHIERMMVSMQELIMQQEESLQTLGNQNEQYREKLTLFQEHILSLKKEQLSQKNEIQKLNFERESFEAEALTLREELRTIKSQLKKTKKEKVAKEKQESPRNGYKKPSVSFDVQPEVFGANAAEARDDAASDIRKSRTQERSVFNRNQRKSPPSPTPKKPTVQRPEQEAVTSPKQNVSGRCADLQELQLRATQLRETVAKMKLDGPKQETTTARLRYSTSEESRDGTASNNHMVSFDARKRDNALRYERSSYWNSYDSVEIPTEPQEHEEKQDDSDLNAIADEIFINAI